MEDLYKYSLIIHVAESIVLFIVGWLIYHYQHKIKKSTFYLEESLIIILFIILVFDVVKGDFSSISNSPDDFPKTHSKNSFEKYNVIGWFQKPINHLVYRDKPFDRNEINFNINAVTEEVYFVFDRTGSTIKNQTPEFKKLVARTKHDLLKSLENDCPTLQDADLSSMEFGDLLLLNILSLLKKNPDVSKVSGEIYWGTPRNGNALFTPINDGFVSDPSCNTIKETITTIKQNPTKGKEKSYSSYYDDILNSLTEKLSNKNSKSISLILIGDFEHESTTTTNDSSPNLVELCDRLAEKMKSAKLILLPSIKKNLSKSCIDNFHNAWINKHFSDNYGEIEAEKTISTEDFLSKVVRTYVKNISNQESNELFFYDNLQRPSDDNESSTFIKADVKLNDAPETLYFTLHSDNSGLNGSIQNDLSSPETSLILEQSANINVLSKKILHFSFRKDLVGKDPNANTFIDIYANGKLWKIKVPVFFKNSMDSPVFWLLVLTVIYSIIFFAFTLITSNLIYFFSGRDQFFANVAMVLVFLLYVITIFQLFLLFPDKLGLASVCFALIIVVWIAIFNNWWKIILTEMKQLFQ